MTVFEELQKAWEKARSVEPVYPDELEYIGMLVKKGTMYMFYRDPSGAYWYKSKRQEV